jgi:peptidoglycan/LPS O-acetylase OafA/YrhL
VCPAIDVGIAAALCRIASRFVTIHCAKQRCGALFSYHRIRSNCAYGPVTSVLAATTAQHCTAESVLMVSFATQIQDGSAASRDAAIDWMRALSILYVAGFWHLHNYTSFVPWYQAQPFARLTVLALALFALISGFLAGKAGKRITARGLGAYYRRRLIRIYPPYLLALIVFTVMNMSGAAFLPSALMVNMIVPPPPFTLWFMTMIVLFYLVAPFLLAMADRPLRLVMIVSLVWVTYFILSRWVLNMEDRLLIYLPVFVAGILIRNAGQRRRKFLLTASALLAVIGYGLSLEAPVLDPDRSLWMALWATSSAVFMFVLLRGHLPRSAIIEELSRGGFFLYLFHRPIYVVLLEVSGVETPWAREVLLLGIGLPVAIAFGIIAQRAYDALIAQLSRHRSAPLTSSHL